MESTWDILFHVEKTTPKLGISVTISLHPYFQTSGKKKTGTLCVQEDYKHLEKETYFPNMSILFTCSGVCYIRGLSM
jgi:hypothetical protein